MERIMDKDLHGLQFSLKGLMGATVVVAMTVAALTHASPTWAGVFLTATVVMLLMATSRAIATRGRTRVFWAAFAVCGWVYFHLIFTPSGLSDFADPYTWGSGSWSYDPSQESRTPVPRLLTTRVLYWAHGAMPFSTTAYTVGSNVSVQSGGSWWPATILEVQGDQYKIGYIGYSPTFDESVTRARIRNAGRDFQSFCVIGQTIWVLLLGLCGGVAARYWWRPAGGPSA
jgi:hypothetical protein